MVKHMDPVYATRFAEWRAGNGLTLQEVGDLTGVSPSVLSRVERGLLALAPLTRVAVARRLGCAVADLFEVETLEAVGS